MFTKILLLGFKLTTKLSYIVSRSATNILVSYNYQLTLLYSYNFQSKEFPSFPVSGEASPISLSDSTTTLTASTVPLKHPN